MKRLGDVWVEAVIPSATTVLVHSLKTRRSGLRVERQLNPAWESEAKALAGRSRNPVTALSTAAAGRRFPLERVGGEPVTNCVTQFEQRTLKRAASSLPKL